LSNLGCRGHWRIKAFQAQAREHLTSLFQILNRGALAWVRFPQILDTTRARHRRQAVVRYHSAGGRERIVLEEVVEQLCGDFDVLDASSGPAFERLAVTGGGYRKSLEGWAR